MDLRPIRVEHLLTMVLVIGMSLLLWTVVISGAVSVADHLYAQLHDLTAAEVRER